MKNSHGPSLTRIGRYEVVTSIGSGGMATIYLARIAGPAGFEKPVALKVIHSHLAEDPQFVQMFFDEARLAAQLQHPNIVQIFELGEAETEGMYYIAMEYLRGETLGAIIQRVYGVENRRMDPRIACHIIQQACDGLHYAHEATTIDDRPMGLVHRDISPQNLFITYSGSVKLMDFGIARAEGAAHSTRPGSLKGKFSYMSPEQVGGHDVDRRSDIFALGVVSWELLTGRRLFKGTTDLESLRFVEECRVPAIAGLRPGIPPAIDKILAKTLARDLGERYQTALDLHQDFGLVMDQLGSPVTTHELAQRMTGWFEKEITAKKRLLTRTISDAPRLSPDQADELPVAREETPSVSEPSGIRLRDVDIVQFAGDPTTPSHPEPFPVPLPPPPRVPAPPRVPLSYDGTGAPVVAGALRDAPPSEAGDEDAARRSGAFLWLLLVGGGLVGVALIVAAALVASSFMDEPPPPSRVDPRLISSDPLVDEADPAELPPPVPAPGAPSVEVGAGVASDVPAGAEDFVTLSLTIRPASATVVVDGELQGNPSAIRLRQGTEPVVVVVSAPRYQEARLSVVPDRDLAQRVSLRRLGRPPVETPPPPTQDDDLVSNPYRPR